MEYVYAAMLLNKTRQKISEENVKKVLEAAGVKPDDTKVKALVAALDGVDIEKVIKEATPIAVAAPAGEKKEEKKKDEPSPEEEKKQEEQATAGLGALFS